MTFATIKVTLHVSVWVEMMIRPTKRTAIMSRSTWACELKSVKTIYVRYNTKVTLHVSVWVEICWICIGINDYTSRSTWACELKWQMKSLQRKNLQVTLHVSVWVEMKTSALIFKSAVVTLHVSVWVEIRQEQLTTLSPRSHAPRERVSWNDFSPSTFIA